MCGPVSRLWFPQVHSVDKARAILLSLDQDIHRSYLQPLDEGGKGGFGFLNFLH